jgi:hypothetical protein
VDSLTRLRALPSGVMARIASSPEYWRRFQRMTRGEQIREASRLTTVLTEAVRSMALAWEPEWALAMSHAHREMDDAAGKADLWLGWVTYLSPPDY